MGYIKFKNSQKIELGNVIPINKNLVEIIFDKASVDNESGFQYNNVKDFSNSVIGNYLDFTTIYKKTDRGIIYSNNKTKYPMKEDEGEVPSLQDRISELEEENRKLKNQMELTQQKIESLIGRGGVVE